MKITAAEAYALSTIEYKRMMNFVYSDIFYAAMRCERELKFKLKHTDKDYLLEPMSNELIENGFLVEIKPLTFTLIIKW